jgi:hypothetical protein
LVFCTEINLATLVTRRHLSAEELKKQCYKTFAAAVCLAKDNAVQFKGRIILSP